jgi:hypothetical protein
MLDRDIRAYLHRTYLHHYHLDGSKVVDEMGLSAHAARIDIGVINGQLVGFEIKSDRDTLDRLPSQMQVYSQIFDLLTVVCGPKHERKLNTWLQEHFPYCGLLVTEPAPGGGTLRPVRPTEQNHQRTGYAVASLLWHEEAKQLLVQLGAGKGLSRLRRFDLWQRLAGVEPDVDILAGYVRKILKDRLTWREA